MFCFIFSFFFFVFFYLICRYIVAYSIPLIDDHEINHADELSEECLNCVENSDHSYGGLNNYHRLRSFYIT